MFEDSKRHVESWASRTGVALMDIRRVLDGLDASGNEGAAAGLHPGQDPTMVFADLPTQAWWDPDYFEWSGTLLDQRAAVAQEYGAFTETHRPSSIDVSRNPLRQSGAWRRVQLVRRGSPRAQFDDFPRTRTALSVVPGATSCGMTFFSVLEAHSSIKPHTGFTNAHLRGHLVLTSCESARLRVADEWRCWVP